MLLNQANWSYNASGNTIGLTFTNSNGDSITASGPAWYDDGTYSINGGAATLVVSTTNGTVNLYHQSGISFSGASDGTNMTLTSTQNGYSVSTVVPLTDFTPYASVRRKPMGLRHTESLHCVAIAIVGLAMMLAILVTALAMIAAVCATATPATCAVAGLLIAALAERLMRSVKDWTHSMGC
jgi:hypothetical protein